MVKGGNDVARNNQRSRDSNQVGVARGKAQNHDDVDDGRHNVGHPQRNCRGTLPIRLAKGRHDVVVSCRHEQNLGSQHDPGQHSASHGNQHCNVDESSAPGTDSSRHRTTHGRIGEPSQLGLCHQAVGQDVDEYQQSQHGKESDNRSLSHIAGLLGTSGVHRSTFDTDEHPDRNQHHVGDLSHDRTEPGFFALGTNLHHVAPEVSRKEADLESHSSTDDKDNNRNDLNRGNNRVHKRSGTNTGQNQEVNQPQADQTENQPRDRNGISLHQAGEYRESA